MSGIMPRRVTGDAVTEAIEEKSASAADIFLINCKY